MPMLKEIEFTSEEVFQLVKQLEFSQKIALLKEITKSTDYRNNFYAYTEGLARKYNIPEMNEQDLDNFLHD